MPLAKNHLPTGPNTRLQKRNANFPDRSLWLRSRRATLYPYRIQTLLSQSPLRLALVPLFPPELQNPLSANNVPLPIPCLPTNMITFYRLLPTLAGVYLLPASPHRTNRFLPGISLIFLPSLNNRSPIATIVSHSIATSAHPL